MRFHNKHVYYGKHAFEVPPEVYAPAEDTSLMINGLVVKRGAKVLDMGTGCGVFAVLAAEKAAKVVAVDLNPHAVACARRNAELNCVQMKVEVRLGNLFEAIDAEEKFDLILFNAPYLPVERGEGDSWVEKAWAGGPSGRVIIDLFIEQAPGYLEDGGRILLVQSSLSDVEMTLRAFERHNFRALVMGEEKLDFERIVLIEARAPA
jgi:release factor glutamine methyltransferase